MVSAWQKCQHQTGTHWTHWAHSPNTPNQPTTHFGGHNLSVHSTQLALHEEWCGEGGTHFLVELALRTSIAASLREGSAAAVWGHHAEVGHSQPVTSQEGVCMRAELGGVGRGWGCARGVMVSAWQKCQYHTDAHWAHSLNTLWWTQLECALHSDQLTRGHIRMGTAPESTAQPLTALTTNYSLHPACMHTAQCSRSHDHTVGWAESGVACGVICRGCSPLHSPTAEWRPQGGRRPPHSLALRGPHPPGWTSTGGHPIVIGMCACVCCVCGPLVPVSLLQLTGLWQSGADTNPPYSLSECDPRVVYTLWCTVGGALPGRGHLMHSSLAAKPSSLHECLVVIGWRRWEEGEGQEKGTVY